MPNTKYTIVRLLYKHDNTQ